MIVRTNRFIQQFDLNDQSKVEADIELRLSDIAGAAIASGAVSVDFYTPAPDFIDAFEVGPSIVVSELDAIRVLDIDSAGIPATPTSRSRPPTGT